MQPIVKKKNKKLLYKCILFIGRTFIFLTPIIISSIYKILTKILHTYRSECKPNSIQVSDTFTGTNRSVTYLKRKKQNQYTVTDTYNIHFTDNILLSVLQRKLETTTNSRYPKIHLTIQRLKLGNCCFLEIQTVLSQYDILLLPSEIFYFFSN